MRPRAFFRQSKNSQTLMVLVAGGEDAGRIEAFFRVFNTETTVDAELVKGYRK